MPKYVISYDIKTAHKRFLTEAEGLGLLYVLDGYVEGAIHLYRLPNTTIWGEFPNKDGALAAFETARRLTAVATGQTIVLEKRLITVLDDYYVTSDRKKTPELRWTGRTGFETCRLHQRNDPFFA